MIRKTANESVTSNTALQNDDHLVLAMGANEAWEFEAWIVCTSANATPDFKYTFVVPSGASIMWSATNQEDSSATLTIQTPVVASGTTRTVDMAANDVHIVRVRGIVVTGASAGNLQLQWAQNASNSNATTVQANSFLKAGRF